MPMDDLRTDNIASKLSEVALTQENDAGLIEAKTGNVLSFSQIDKRADQYAWYLQKSGVKAGDRVMLMVKPSADFICLTFALFKLGAPVILIDPGMGYKNLLRCVSTVAPVVFIGIPMAHLFVRIFRSRFDSIRQKFCCGNSFGVFGKDIRKASEDGYTAFPAYTPAPDDLAAIIFTTGSTGPPKGVRYEHTVFSAQLRHIKSYYKIGQADIDQPAFPLFALFSTALGAYAVIPDMDPTKPAKVDPLKFVASLEKYGVTYSFGSPALWKVVCEYCLRENRVLFTLQKILMAGAPVSGDLLKKLKKILPPTTEIHIPYGATESLPIVSIEAREILAETWHLTQRGKGTCVGRPLPGISIRIIEIHDEKLATLNNDVFLGVDQIGEIIVSGDVVTKAYDNNERETELAKIQHDGRLWHRMGDIGFIDAQNRLWFCGRKAHRVQTAGGVKFTIQCEAIANNHPDVNRSALVGISGGRGDRMTKIPVLILEKEHNCRRKEEDIIDEVRQYCSASPLTKDIEIFLFHPKFPVDIRHNAKIFREKLAKWAETELEGKV
ncbi:MAG: fatty acid CoA ligase family protein [Desulfopila sp.]|jgi:acyl-CoA synthetase (AMP-forming)/AMP-acid ligase II|nr:fatty acid CoA ligase family protein [Desulfopila sp.]